MERTMANKQSAKSANYSSRPGCGTTLAYFGWTTWVVIISAADIYWNWMTEQVLFESSQTGNDLRWLNHIIFMALLFIPLLVGFITTKAPRLKNTLQVWMLAAGFSLAVFPAKRMWVTYQQEATVLLMLTMLIFVGGLYFHQRRHPSEVAASKKKSSWGGLAVIIAVSMAFPWFLWGALGSLNDTVLYLCLGVVFAYFTVMVLYPYFFDRDQNVDREPRVGDFLFNGFVVAIFFLLMITGLGQNGSQPLLLITLPLSGFIIAFFAIIARDTRGRGKIIVAVLAALELVLPLLWFDMDELFLLIAGSPGEALDWAMRAAWSTFSVSLLVLVINLVNLKKVTKIKINRKVNLILSGIVISALAVVYFLFGQPGFHGEKVFIVMNEQADITEIANITDLAERKQAVYDTLVTTAEESQVSLKQQLDSWHVQYTSYYLVNGIEADLNPFLRMFIERRADVARVLDSPQLRPLPEPVAIENSSPTIKPEDIPWNLAFIGVDKVHSELGISGEGIVIGQTDTGVDGRNLELVDSYHGLNNSDDYNWLDPWYDSPFPSDGIGHGTATLSVITGKDIGIAPDAEWMGCVNLGRNLGNPAHYLDCMQFMLAPYPHGGNAFTDGAPSQGAMIVNNSWGCPLAEGCDAETFQSAVDAMETAGIFMSVAAGNTGYYGCSTITDPLAIYADVFTVGSIDQDGNLSDFSSLGPITVDGSGRIKPNLLAPGQDIVTAFPDNQYATMSGTSFAAPHVAGVVALMWSANPGLIGNIDLTRSILDETAAPYTGAVPECVADTSIPNDAAGYGIVDAYAAVQKALSLK
jgi:subtilisin family serine protease